MALSSSSSSSSPDRDSSPSPGPLSVSICSRRSGSWIEVESSESTTWTCYLCLEDFPMEEQPVATQVHRSQNGDKHEEPTCKSCYVFETCRDCHLRCKCSRAKGNLDTLTLGERGSSPCSTTSSHNDYLLPEANNTSAYSIRSSFLCEHQLAQLESVASSVIYENEFTPATPPIRPGSAPPGNSKLPRFERGRPLIRVHPPPLQPPGRPHIPPGLTAPVRASLFERGRSASAPGYKDASEPTTSFANDTGICAGCLVPVNGLSARAGEGNSLLYHRRCFKCVVCGGRLGSKAQSVHHLTGKPCHLECLRRNSHPEPSQSVDDWLDAPKLSRSVSEDVPRLASGQDHARHDPLDFSSDTKRSSRHAPLQLCAACGMMTSYFSCVIGPGGKRFHPECLKCLYCRKPVGWLATPIKSETGFPAFSCRDCCRLMGRERLLQKEIEISNEKEAMHEDSDEEVVFVARSFRKRSA